MMKSWNRRFAAVSSSAGRATSSCSSVVGLLVLALSACGSQDESVTDGQRAEETVALQFINPGFGERVEIAQDSFATVEYLRINKATRQVPNDYDVEVITDVVANVIFENLGAEEIFMPEVEVECFETLYRGGGDEPDEMLSRPIGLDERASNYLGLGPVQPGKTYSGEIVTVIPQDFDCEQVKVTLFPPKTTVDDEYVPEGSRVVTWVHGYFDYENDCGRWCLKP